MSAKKAQLRMNAAGYYVGAADGIIGDLFLNGLDRLIADVQLFKGKTASVGDRLGGKSLEKLEGVHPDLVRVVKRAAELSPVPFVVLEGLRTKGRQKELFDKRATKTMNSRHLTGHAVDLAPTVGGVVSWDWPLYHQLAPVVKQAASELGVALDWGGDWRTFKDGPHWELRWANYPA